MLKKQMKVRLERREAEETRRPQTVPSSMAAPYERCSCSRGDPNTGQLSLVGSCSRDQVGEWATLGAMSKLGSP